MHQSARSTGLAGPPHQTHTHSGDTLAQTSVRLSHSKWVRPPPPPMTYLSLCLLPHPPPPSPPPPPVALSPWHSLKTLRGSRGERRTQLPHPTSSLILWDGSQQQSDVGATGATKHPQTLEPELPPSSASTPTFSFPLSEGGSAPKHQNHSVCVSQIGRLVPLLCSDVSLM